MPGKGWRGPGAGKGRSCVAAGGGGGCASALESRAAVSRQRERPRHSDAGVCCELQAVNRGGLAANGAKKIRQEAVRGRFDSPICSTSDRPNTSKSKRTAELVPSKFARGSEASSNSCCTLQSTPSPRRSARQTSL